MLQLSKKAKNFPDKPGVYLFKGPGGRVIYVGKAGSLKKRVSSYFNAPAGSKADLIATNASDIEYIITTSELEALLLEGNLIKKYDPRYNVLLRDDKAYPYIKLTMNEEWPRALIVRKIEDDGSAYFGPYRGQTARDILKMFKRLLQLRWCRNFKAKKEPCFYYHLKRCLGPCVGNVSKKEYMAMVGDAVDFLEGRLEGVVNKLKKEMKEASASQNYEKAARLRDRIRAFKRILENQQVVTVEKANKDAVALTVIDNKAMFLVLQVRDGKLIGKESYFIRDTKGEAEDPLLQSTMVQYYSSASKIPDEIIVDPDISDIRMLKEAISRIKVGPVRIVAPSKGNDLKIFEMAKVNAGYLLEQNMKLKTGMIEVLGELKDILKLPKLPVRIEAFDISTIMGAETVGSMVVFEEGQPRKSDYRKFKVKRSGKIDDVASMHEVVSRRYHGGLTGQLPYPDLILVDGGITQVSAAVKAVKGTSAENLPIAGLAKKLEQIYLHGRKNPITLPRRTSALKLLQRIRDEAHRFAITFHKLRRKKAMLSG